MNYLFDRNLATSPINKSNAKSGVEKKDAGKKVCGLFLKYLFWKFKIREILPFPLKNFVPCMFNFLNLFLVCKDNKVS